MYDPSQALHNPPIQWQMQRDMKLWRLNVYHGVRSARKGGLSEIGGQFMCVQVAYNDYAFV